MKVAEQILSGANAQLDSMLVAETDVLSVIASNPVNMWKRNQLDKNYHQWQCKWFTLYFLKHLEYFVMCS